MAAVLGVLYAVAPAAAVSGVYLNGVNIDGVTNQKFDKCTVTIDAQGNVHIEAKGYAVQANASGAVPTQPGKITQRYFLVTEQTQKDGAQFDVAVFINAKWIRELKSNEDQIVTEITKHLKPGGNKIVLAATKRIDGQRHSASQDVFFRVIIGEGNAAGDNVMIDRPLVQMKRTAAETENITEEFTLNAR
jgi:hypothetical protein